MGRRVFADRGRDPVGIARFHDPGHAEVEDLGAAVGGEEDVRRLHVAVDDALLVGGGESRRHLHRDVDRAARRQRAALQRLVQGLAFEQLRDHIRRRTLDVHVVDRHDVGVAERRGRSRLLCEAVESIGPGGDRRGQHLDGHVAAEPRIPRAEHLAHAPGADGRDDLVGAKACAGGYRHRGDYSGAIRAAGDSLIHCPAMQSVEAFLARASDFVWGPPLLILLFGTHLFLTFRLRFIQRYLPQAIRSRSRARRRARATSASSAR